MLEGTEVRIGADGEVQIRGPDIMAGYHNLAEATAAAFTEDGWLRTGDEGRLDDEGFLSIIGRIKDMFKTSGGKYTVPPAIEEKFIASCPYASQFLVFGRLVTSASRYRARRRRDCQLGRRTGLDRRDVRGIGQVAGSA